MRRPLPEELVVFGRVHKGVPWVSATVRPARGEAHEVWFMVDSGAETSMLSRADAVRFRLDPDLERQDLVSFGGRVTGRVFPVSLDFSIGTGIYEIRDTRLLVPILVSNAPQDDLFDVSVMGRDLLRNFTEFSFPCSVDHGQVRLKLGSASELRAIGRNRYARPTSATD